VNQLLRRNNVKYEFYQDLSGLEINFLFAEYFYSDNRYKETEYLGMANFEEQLTDEQLQYLHQCK
jgi:hypothetical protein